MNNDDFDVTYVMLSFLIVVFSSLFLGTVYGIYLGEKSATRETVKTCVENPQKCKIMYDFYKLSESKK